MIEIAAKPRSNGEDIKIVCDHILPQQEIEFEADLDCTLNYDSTLSVAEALSIISKLNNATPTAEIFEIKGIITSVQEISVQYGNATFFIGDSENATERLYIWRTKGFNGEDITNEYSLKVGDEVVARGLLQKYINQGTVVPEIPTGTIVSINGSTSDILSVSYNETTQKTIYNLAGQRLSKPQKGINIIDGKKVVVK